jgi:DUF4097 and DUF4098 domain-containing protein YvlB
MKFASAYVILCWNITALTSAQQPAALRQPIAPDASVEIDAMTGEIRVVGWDRNEISVMGVMGEAVDMDVDADEEQVEIVFDPGGYRRHDEGETHIRHDVDVEVRVPRGVDLEITSITATVEITGVRGRIDVETASGSIAITGDARSISAESMSGSITIHGAAAEIDAESTSGSIVVSDGAGALKLETTSAEIIVQGGQFDEADLESFSGLLEFDGALDPSGTFTFETHSGSVTLILPDDVSARFDIATATGSIGNDFGPSGRRTSRFGPGRELRFRTGDARADVQVETFSGSVELRHR